MRIFFFKSVYTRGWVSKKLVGVARDKLGSQA
jgi:hypothetical protein